MAIEDSATKFKLFTIGAVRAFDGGSLTAPCVVPAEKPDGATPYLKLIKPDTLKAIGLLRDADSEYAVYGESLLAYLQDQRKRIIDRLIHKWLVDQDTMGTDHAEAPAYSRGREVLFVKVGVPSIIDIDTPSFRVGDCEVPRKSIRVMAAAHSVAPVQVELSDENLEWVRLTCQVKIFGKISEKGI